MRKGDWTAPPINLNWISLVWKRNVFFSFFFAPVDVSVDFGIFPTRLRHTSQQQIRTPKLCGEQLGMNTHQKSKTNCDWESSDRQKKSYVIVCFYEIEMYDRPRNKGKKLNQTVHMLCRWSSVRSDSLSHLHCTSNSKLHMPCVARRDKTEWTEERNKKKTQNIRLWLHFFPARQS